MRCPSFLFSALMLAMWVPQAVADGFVYRLPKDGTWAKFAIEGKMLDDEQHSVDPALHVSGSLTICCVGTERVDGEVCRWIEIVIDGQRAGRAFVEVHKLLIVEQEIGEGKDSLQHLRQAWYRNSAVDEGKPRQLTDAERADPNYRQRVRALLHPPFQSIQSSDAVEVECRLGKVPCTQVMAKESETQPGSEIEYVSEYAIWLHQDAPFGVAAWRAISRVYRKGELEGASKLTLVLSDFGQGAKSQIEQGQVAQGQ